MINAYCSTPSTVRRLKPGGARPKAGLEIAVSNELTTATGGRVLRELRPKENLNLKIENEKKRVYLKEIGCMLLGKDSKRKLLSWCLQEF